MALIDHEGMMTILLIGRLGGHVLLVPRYETSRPTVRLPHGALALGWRRHDLINGERLRRWIQGACQPFLLGFKPHLILLQPRVPAANRRYLQLRSEH